MATGTVDKDMKRFLYVLLGIALFSAACGAGEESGALRGCEWNGLPDWVEEPVSGVNLRFDSSDYQAGDLATFRWKIEEGIEAVVGDEAVVSCFDGENNSIAWQANGVFSDEPSFLLTSEAVGGDDEGFDPIAGAVAIPPDAPIGFYTAVIEGAVFGTDGESLGAFQFDASFVLVG